MATQRTCEVGERVEVIRKDGQRMVGWVMTASATWLDICDAPLNKQLTDAWGWARETIWQVKRGSKKPVKAPWL